MFTQSLRLLFSLLLICSATAFATEKHLLNEFEGKTYSVAMHNDDVITRTLFNLLGQELNIHFTYVNYPSFTTALSATALGYVDFMGNVINNPERAKRVDFSVPTNIQNMFMFSEHELSIEHFSKVAVPRGGVSYHLLAQQYPDVEIIKYDTAAQAKRLLEEKEIDGAIGSINYLKFMSNARINAHLLGMRYPLKPVSIIAPKGRHQELLTLLGSTAISPKIQKQLNKTIKHYIRSLQVQTLREKISAANFIGSEPLKIKIINADNQVHFHQDGKVDGIAYDVAFQACQMMELACELVSTSDESWDNMLDDLLSERIDMLASVAKTEEREAVMHISSGFYNTDGVLVKRKGYKHNVYHHISELFSERVGLMRGTSFKNTLTKYLPNNDFQSFNSMDEMVDALINNQVDYIVMTKSAFNELQHQAKGILPIGKVTSIGSFDNIDFGFGFQLNERGKELSQLFSYAIQLIDTNRIIRNYNHQVNWKDTSDYQTRLTGIVIKVCLLLSGILALVFFYWRKKSTTDALTRLKNRFSLNSRHGKGIKSGQSLVYFDVNKFKQINDGYSHAMGDEVLKRIAGNIQYYWSGYSYRIGGDEFVLIGRYSESELHDIMDKIGFFDFAVDASTRIQVSISYGIYLSEGDVLPLDEMLHLADSEMYKHKSH